MDTRIIEFLQRLVRCQSLSGTEESAVACWAEFAQDSGFVPVIDGRNVWVEWRQNDGPMLLLNSHHDTVKAGPTWTRDPWDGALEDGRVHGLGANDAKGCVASQIGALIALRDSGFRGNVMVCASCEEETGGAGMERIAKTMPHYDAALIGEPNNFAVAAGQRGLVKGYIDVPGRRAHASRPWQGHNAIHAAAKVIAAVEAPHLNIPNDLTKATAQVTVIAGGTQSNVIPDACRLTIDCRTTPEFDNAAMLEHLRACAEAGGGQWVLHSERFKPCLTRTDDAIVRAALKVTGSAKATVFPSVCDLFWVSHVPSLVMGPGQPERSHQADEFVLVDEVLRGVQTYADIARLWWDEHRPT
jgi:acetylornithine deacetylase